MNTYDKIIAIKDACKSGHALRIISESIYACELSKTENGAYDELIKCAVDYLYLDFQTVGCVTLEAVRRCEEMLLPLGEKAKSYKLNCVSHAHIDMNWMWSFNETVAITLDTFRTILTLMNEYPTFTFSQSQTSTYRIVEEYDPAMFEQIRKRVAEGRWEVSASTWVEADKNLPNGESLARQMLYTKNYFKEKFGIASNDLALDFEPDTFGHNFSVPEILLKGNVRYYYHCRGYEGHNIYNWQSPSGSRILVYREPAWYNASITPDMMEGVPMFCHENHIDFMLKVYGVGDHGGGPTRKDIETLLDMSQWPIAPTIEFGTYHRFFRKLEENRNLFPTVFGELNYVFTGCYSSQARIKASNRVAEDSLYASETATAIALQYADGDNYTANYKSAWEKVLFNQFHDIITGSGVRETREYALGEIQKTLGFTYAGMSKALVAISKKIDTSSIILDSDPMSNSEGGGVGYRGSRHLNSTFIANQTIQFAERGSGRTRIIHVFNPTAFNRNETTEITLWDYCGKTDQISITDTNGNNVAFKIIEHHGFWGHIYDKFLIETSTKAFGYNTYIIQQSPRTQPLCTHAFEPRLEIYHKNILENAMIRAEFDDNNMILKKLTDKKTGEVLINQDAAWLKLVMQNHKGFTVMFGNAWSEGFETQAINLNATEQVFVTEHSYDNVLRQHIKYSIPFMSSNIQVTVSLDKNDSYLRYQINCDWHEKFSETKGIPTLKFVVPVAYETNEYLYESQFGVASRSDMNHDVPGRGFALAVKPESENGIAVFTDNLHAYRGEKNTIQITLLRSSQDPDPYPEDGMHSNQIGVGIIKQDNISLYKQSCAFSIPLSCMTNTSHKGSLPLEQSFFSTSGDIMVSSVKISEDGSEGLVFRVYDTTGIGTAGSIQFTQSHVMDAELLDMAENPINGSEVLSFDERIVSFKLKPFETITLRVRVQLR